MGSLLYSLVRFWLDAIATSHGDQAKLQAEGLALRRQVKGGNSPSNSPARL